MLAKVVVTEVVVSDETRPLPHYLVSVIQFTPNLTRVKWRDWLCWRRQWQRTVTHGCGSTLRSALSRLEHRRISLERMYQVWDIVQQGRPCHPTVLGLIISLPFHLQLIHALVAPSITNAFEFVMRNPIVTPQRFRAYIGRS